MSAWGEDLAASVLPQIAYSGFARQVIAPNAPLFVKVVYSTTDEVSQLSFVERLHLP
ncbi:hypothetical protein [Shewanella sp. NIFS-20-20]|uniref:hypothetical protein n=1 Tax=Shewanella sp. NIFS-20-20 TaxID=2853806 RepID=UPI001C48196A|nr:hypothetical protein [Shewanella sp. NIFS-20-20]MBV7314170.1 hypothetical protein [Shewanella sp. NIFS-20-20]